MILFRRMSFSHTIQCESLFSFIERRIKLRYESFYPFAHNQSPPPAPRQQGPGFNPFVGPSQNLPTHQSQANPGQPMQPRLPGQPGQPGLPGQPGQGPSKVEAYMQTAQQFMNTAQQFAPVVQQFAPMVKNLPAMWRLYKGFQSLPNTGAPSIGSGGIPPGAAPSPSQFTAANTGPQPSVPRIFQPPGR